MSGKEELLSVPFFLLIQSLLSEVFNVVFYSRWIVDMEGAPGTLYEGEKFQLLFKFSSRYPFDSPQVTALLLKIIFLDYSKMLN